MLSMVKINILIIKIKIGSINYLLFISFYFFQLYISIKKNFYFYFVTNCKYSIIFFLILQRVYNQIFYQKVYYLLI